MEHASLGCASPGRTYAQVITPGFQIMLQVDGKKLSVSHWWGVASCTASRDPPCSALLRHQWQIDGLPGCDRDRESGRQAPQGGGDVRRAWQLTGDKVRHHLCRGYPQ